MGNDDSRIIPRFIHARDEYARRQGLEARSAVCNDADGTPLIESTWRGPESAFRAIGVLAPHEHAPIQAGHKGTRIRKHWDEGRLHLCADGLLQFVVVNDVPLGVDMLPGDIERCTFPANWRHTRRLVFHGTERDLLNAELLPYPSGRPWRKGVRAGSGWRAELQPDQSLVFWLLEERHGATSWRNTSRHFSTAAKRDVGFQRFMRALT